MMPSFQSAESPTYLMLIMLLAKMPGVARGDHRTKCVSLVAISLSQNTETRNCWPA
jgi:hypothetical protein